MDRRKTAAVTTVAAIAAGIIAGAAMSTEITMPPEPTPIVEVVLTGESGHKAEWKKPSMLHAIFRALLPLSSLGWMILRGTTTFFMPIFLRLLVWFSLGIILLFSPLFLKRFLPLRSPAVLFFTFITLLTALDWTLFSEVSFEQLKSFISEALFSSISALIVQHMEEREYKKSRAGIEETALRLADSVCPRRF